MLNRENNWRTQHPVTDLQNKTHKKQQHPCCFQSKSRKADQTLESDENTKIEGKRKHFFKTRICLLSKTHLRSQLLYCIINLNSLIRPLCATYGIGLLCYNPKNVQFTDTRRGNILPFTAKIYQLAY